MTVNRISPHSVAPRISSNDQARVRTAAAGLPAPLPGTRPSPEAIVPKPLGKAQWLKSAPGAPDRKGPRVDLQSLVRPATLPIKADPEQPFSAEPPSDKP
ncbi:MAG TPA: hypothetical protein VLJ86_26050 [Ramlibacter sp.]|nr:hypothetical protein [Ramlibacter sp.]